MKKLVIEKDKLIENIDILKDKANGCKIIGVVKFNGYGLDIIEYSKLLLDNGIDMLAVSSVEEAIKLRENKIKCDILMLSSCAFYDEVELLVKNNIILSIGSFDAISVAEKVARKNNTRVRCHIKLDTGFGRYGFLPDEVDELILKIKKFKNIDVEGFFSHFSSSFNNRDYTFKQFDIFCKLLDKISESSIDLGMKHICNSSAFIKYDIMHLDAVRIGSAFLGRLAFNSNLKLNRICFIESVVGEVKNLPNGSNIGYNNVFSLKKDTKCAIIPVGGVDGFKMIPSKDLVRFKDKIRYIINDIKYLFKGPNHFVTINNKQYRVLGRIAKGQVICDITGSDVSVGDKVVIDVNPLFVDSSMYREYR